MKKQKVTVRAKMVQTDAEGNIKKYSVMDSRRGHSFEVPQFILKLRNWAIRNRRK
jgi:CYTH domain-containing protein